MSVIGQPKTIWSHCVIGQSTCLSEVQCQGLVSVAFILHHDAHVPRRKMYRLIKHDLNCITMTSTPIYILEQYNNYRHFHKKSISRYHN